MPILGNELLEFGQRTIPGAICHRPSHSQVFQHFLSFWREQALAIKLALAFNEGRHVGKARACVRHIGMPVMFNKLLQLSQISIPSVLTRRPGDAKGFQRPPSLRPKPALAVKPATMIKKVCQVAEDGSQRDVGMSMALDEFFELGQLLIPGIFLRRPGYAQ